MTDPTQIMLRPRNSEEIVAILLDAPEVQFRVPVPYPPALLVGQNGEYLALLRQDGQGPGRWIYVPVNAVEVVIPPAYVMENRAPNDAELADMDGAERADWEERTRDTPALDSPPPPSEY